MKKIILCFFACAMFFSVSAQSGFANRVQDLTGTQFNWGPKVGFNITNISNFGENAKFSFHGGLWGEFEFTDILGLQVELLYSRQGTRDKENNSKEIIRVNYLNIPILAKVYLMEGLSFEVGPQLGFALNSKAVIKSGSSTFKTKMNGINTVDLSLGIGLSYELEMGLIVSARYNLGLTNVIDDDHYGKGNKNRVFQFGVGWRF